MRLGGHYSRGGSVTWASDISVMISHWMGGDNEGWRDDGFLSEW